MVAAAAEKGLQVLGITEHGPGIPGTCNPIYFKNLHVVPRMLNGVRLLLGAELNILDTEGHLDLDEDFYQRMDIRIAGQHAQCWKGGTRLQNTEGMIAAIRNPWVHIISHPTDGTADMDFDPIVQAARDSHTLLEINSSTLKPIRHKLAAYDNTLEVLRLSMKYDVPIILGSDAHVSYAIADYRYALPLLEEVQFPQELIINDKPELFFDYLGIDPVCND